MNSQTTPPVVVGVDGRPGSTGAIRYAVTEARRRVAPLHLVHVVPSYLSMGTPVPLTDLETIGMSILREQVETVHALDPALAVNSVLVHGERDDGIVEAAQGAQLVVVGRETRHGLDRLLTGTTTYGVAARATSDVVVVPSFWTGDHTRGRVVVGVKSGGDNHELLDQAFAEASARGAVLTLVTAWHLADPYFDRIEARTHAADWEAHGIEVLQRVTKSLTEAYPDVEVETRVVHGAPARVLLHASEDSDLLVLSRRHHALPPYGHLGGVAHDVLRLADVPVHVVPYPAHAATDEELVLEAAGAPVK
jgi:nucleotide-binding universal stress UspA family protein